MRMTRRQLTLVLVVLATTLLALAPASGAQVPTSPPEVPQLQQGASQQEPETSDEGSQATGRSPANAADCDTDPQAAECQAAADESAPGAESAGAGDRLNCEDFDSQNEAQAELDSDPSDPNDLDRNDDGDACEDFNYGSSGDGADPAGGIETGFGGMVPSSGPDSSEQGSLPLMLGGGALALLSLGLGGLALRSRAE